MLFHLSHHVLGEVFSHRCPGIPCSPRECLSFPVKELYSTDDTFPVHESFIQLHNHRHLLHQSQSQHDVIFNDFNEPLC